MWERKSKRGGRTTVAGHDRDRDDREHLGVGSKGPRSRRARVRFAETPLASLETSKEPLSKRE